MREKSSDGRAKNPILTIKGSEIIKRALPVVETKDAEFFHTFTKEEKECIARYLSEINSKEQGVS